MLCDHPPACPPSCSHCLAYDRHTRSLCSRSSTSSNSKWCQIHEELQAKLLKSYKRLTLAVESFDDSTLPPSVETISHEEDMIQLRRWSESSRTKWGLTRRVVVSRAEHHQQFYAGGDWGHCLFVETLKEESERLEHLMRILDRRAYTLTLLKSQAEWILSAPSVGFICDEPSTIETPPTPPMTPPMLAQTLPSSASSSSGSSTSAAPAFSKNQRKKVRRKARKGSIASLNLSPADDCCPEENKLSRHFTTADHLARLRAYLVPPPDLPSSIRSSTWRALISGLFRYVILRIPSLALLALDADPRGDGSGSLGRVDEYMDFLEERTSLRCGEEVNRLWRGLKFAKSSPSKEDSDAEGFLGVGVLSDAIADVFRVEVGDENEEGGPKVYVELLGGRVYKEGRTAELPGEGWDLFYQFIGCSGCSLSITRSYTTWARNRRLALLGAYPAWLSPSETPAEHVFRLAGIALCSSNLKTCGKKVKRIEQKDHGVGAGRRRQARKIVLVEEWERAWVYLKFPLNSPWTNATLDALAALPDRFVVLARNGETLETTHTPALPSMCKSNTCKCCTRSDLWLGRVRSGLSPAERRAANWTPSTYFPIDTVLTSFSTNSSPETRFGFTYADVYDVLIMDDRSYTESSSTSGEWPSFSQSVASVVMRAKGCESLQQLLVQERAEAREKGEMGEQARAKDETKEVYLSGGKSGVVYAAFDERLTARELFKEEV